MANTYNFNPVVADAVQAGIMDFQFLSGMDSVLAYSYFTYKEKLAAKLGETKTFTKNARLPVDITPSAADDGTADLNNNMTFTKSGIEQFTLTIKQWNRADKVNLMQDEFMIASDLERSMGNLGQNCAQLKERLVRKAYLDSYLSGNSRVITGGTTNTTNAHVDDIRGFQFVLDSGGALQAVSGGNTLSVNEIDANGNVVQILTVTGAVADGSNVSSIKGGTDVQLGGISGQLTFSTASAAPTAGNALVASQAPKVFRAGGRVHSGLLSAGDITTVDNLDDVVTYLRNQGNPGALGGSIYAIAGPSAMRQWRRDPQFQLAYQGRYEAPEIRSGRITEYGGVKFVETTEVPITTNADGTNVHRVLFIADDEVCMEADWDGFDNFIAGKANDPLHYVKKVQSNAAIFVREPLDILGEQQPFAYKMVTGFACGSDLKANQQIIPTASTAMFKKAAWLEFAA